MTPPAVRLSIVCPAYQEEEVLPPFHAELIAVLDGLGPEFEIEILYVDDGSRDRTLEVIRTLAATDVRVRYLSLSRNFGHQAALTAGLEHANGDVVITLDSDLQHPPALIPELLTQWQAGHDVVLTLREDDPQLGFAKRLTSRVFYRLMNAVSKTEMRAAAADFRLMTRKAVNGLLQMREAHRFLRGMVSWLGFNTATVPYTPSVRAAGLSKYTLRKMIHLAVDGLLSFSRLPLRLATIVGGAFCTIGLLLAGAGATRWALAAAPVELGWYAVMASVWFVGGATLGGVGIVGEYVGRIFEQVKDRPSYVIKEASPELVGIAESAPRRRAA